MKAKVTVFLSSQLFTNSFENVTITHPPLSDRINRLKESETIKMASLSRELRAQGLDIIDLSLGEPDFDTPQHIKDAANQAMKDGYTHYTPVPGYMELREAISRKFKRDNGLDYSPHQIVVSTGAKQSLANVALCLLNPGDEAILPAPYWVSYAAIVELAQGIKVEIPTSIEQDFKFTPEQLEASITEKTRFVMMCSPCNPTGSVYSYNELQQIARVLERYPEVFVVADEIYEYINYTDSHASLASFDFIKDQVITVNGFSKGFAMTGWRVGYLGAPDWVAKACNKMQGQFTSGTCSIAQKAAETAISGDLAPTYAMKAAFKKRLEFVHKTLNEIPGVRVNKPQGAFYIFPEISSYFGKSDGETSINNPNDLAMYLLKDANVAVVTGRAFGDDNCIRISYAASEEKLKEALNRIANSLSKLH